MSAMRQTHEFLQGIRQSVESLDRSMGRANIGKHFTDIGRDSASGTGQAEKELRDLSKTAHSTAKDVKELRNEFQTLKVEAKSVDFKSGLANNRAFKVAAKEVKQYAGELKALQTQAKKTSETEQKLVKAFTRSRKGASEESAEKPSGIKPSAGFKFDFKVAVGRKPNESIQQMQASIEDLDRSMGRANIGKQFTEMGQDAVRGTGQIEREFRGLSGTTATTVTDLKGLKSEFRALRAESKLIDFGADLQDDRQFKVAAQQVHTYVDALKSLESQVGQTGTAEREFAATLKRQQGISSTQVEITGQQRKAALAAERGGAANSLRDSGQMVMDQFSAPLASALELQKSLAGVQKLASDISDTGFKSLGNQVFLMSSDLAVADTEVTKVLEDLAGSGKKFTDAIDPSTSKSFLSARIAETEQILKNKAALDVTTDAATGLNVTLGSIYKNELPNYQGGIAELNARAASSVNELADKLENVKISAEDVLPTMKIVLNTVGNAKNFPIDQVAAYSAAISSLGTIEPEAAGSFLNRLGATMANPKMTKVFSQKLGYGGVDEFDKEVNTDKLAVIQKIAEAYKNVKGGELKQGAFLGSLGISSVQDQKLIQGLSSQLEVLADARKVSRKGFQGVDDNGNVLAELSINAELGRTMQTSAFQAERFQQSVKSLKDSFASMALETLSPLIGLMGNGMAMVLRISQKFPGLTKAVIVSAIAFGALATVLGTVGVLLFGLQQASATASVAMFSLSKGLIPLTGFFATATGAFTSTNPLITILSLLKAGFAGLLAPLSSATSLLGTLGSVIAGAVLSPVGLTIAAIVGLIAVLELATPQASVLGTVLGAIAAPVALLIGFIKGFSREIMTAFAPVANVLTQAFAVPLQALGGIVQQAQKIFQSFERTGESAGAAVARAILTPFQIAGNRIGQIWNSTIGSITTSFAPLMRFAEQVGMWLVRALAENSPGPTFLIRQKWEQTISFIQQQIAGWVDGLKSIKSTVEKTFRDLSTQIQSFFRWDQMVQGIALLNQNLDIFTATISRLAGQASAAFTQLRTEFDRTAAIVRPIVARIVDEVAQLRLDTPEQQFVKFNAVLGFMGQQFGVLSGYVDTFSRALVNNLDFIALVAFALSSMPMGLVKGLASGSALSNALKGLPKILALLLPSIVGTGISTGLFESVKDALGQKLQTLIIQVAGQTGANFVASFTSAIDTLSQHVQAILQPFFQYLGAAILPIIQAGFFRDIIGAALELEHGIPQLIAIFKGLYETLKPFITIGLQLANVFGFLLSLPFVTIYSFVKPLLDRIFPPLLGAIAQTGQALKLAAATKFDQFLTRFPGIVILVNRITAAATFMGQAFMTALKPVIALLRYGRDVVMTFASAVQKVLPKEALSLIGSSLMQIIKSFGQLGTLAKGFFRVLLGMGNYVGSSGFFDFGVEIITPLDLFLKTFSTVGENIVKVKLKALTLKRGIMAVGEGAATAGKEVKGFFGMIGKVLGADRNGLKFLDRIRIFMPAQIQLLGAVAGAINLIYIAFKVANREWLRSIPAVGEGLALAKSIVEGFYEEVLPLMFKALAVGVAAIAIASVFVAKWLVFSFNLMSTVYNRVSDVLLTLSGIIHTFAQPVTASRAVLEGFLKTLRGDDFQVPEWAVRTLEMLDQFQFALRPIAQLAEAIGGMIGAVAGFGKSLLIAIPVIIFLFRVLQTKNPLLALKDALTLIPRLIAGIFKAANFAKTEITQKGIDTMEHQIQKKALNLKLNFLMPQYERDIQTKELSRQKEVMGFRKALDSEAQQSLRKAGIWGKAAGGRYSDEQMDQARGAVMADDRAVRSVAMASGVNSFRDLATGNHMERLKMLSDDTRTKQYIETGSLTSRDLHVNTANIGKALIGGQPLVAQEPGVRSQIASDPRVLSTNTLQALNDIHATEQSLKNFQSALNTTEESLREMAKQDLQDARASRTDPSYSRTLQVGNRLGLQDEDLLNAIDQLARTDQDHRINQNSMVQTLLDRQTALREAMPVYQKIAQESSGVKAPSESAADLDRKALAAAVGGRGGGPLAMITAPLQRTYQSLARRFEPSPLVQSQVEKQKMTVQNQARSSQLRALGTPGQTDEMVAQNKLSLELLQRYNATPEAQRPNTSMDDLRAISQLLGKKPREDMSPDQLVQQIAGMSAKINPKMTNLKGQISGGVEGLVSREFSGTDANRQQQLIALLKQGHLDSLAANELLRVSAGSGISIPQLFDPKATVTRAQERSAVPLRQEALLQMQQKAGMQDSAQFLSKLKERIPGGSAKTDKQMSALYKQLGRGEFDDINEGVLAGIARLLKVQSEFGDSEKGLAVQMRKQFSAQSLIAERERSLTPIQRISRRVGSIASAVSPGRLPGVRETSFSLERRRSLKEIDQSRQKQIGLERRRESGLKTLMDTKSGDFTELAQQLSISPGQMTDIAAKLTRGQWKEIEETHRDAIATYLSISNKQLGQLEMFSPPPPTAMQSMQKKLSRYVAQTVDQIQAMGGSLLDKVGSTLDAGLKKLAVQSPRFARGLEITDKVKTRVQDLRKRQQGYEQNRQFSLQQMMKQSKIGTTHELWDELKKEGLDLEQIQSFLKGPQKDQSLRDSLGGGARGGQAIDKIADVFGVRPGDLEAFQKNYTAKVVMPFPVYLGQQLAKAAGRQILETAKAIGQRGLRAARRGVRLAMAIVGPKIYRAFGRTALAFGNRSAVSLNNSLRMLFPKNELLKRVETGILRRGEQTKAFFENRAANLEQSNPLKDLIASTIATTKAITENFKALMVRIRDGVKAAMSRVPGLLNSLFSLMGKTISGVIGGFRWLYGKVTDRNRRSRDLKAEVATSKEAIRGTRQQRTEKTAEFQSTISGIGQTIQRRGQQLEVATDPREQKSLAKQIRRAEAGKQLMTERMFGMMFDTSEQQQILKAQRSSAIKRLAKWHQEKNPLEQVIDFAMGGVTKTISSLGRNIGSVMSTGASRLMAKGHRQAAGAESPFEKLSPAPPPREGVDNRLVPVTSLGDRVLSGMQIKAGQAAQSIAMAMRRAAEQSTGSWEASDRAIREGVFGRLVKRALWTGQKILGYISEASPGPSYQIRQNYAMTADSVEGSMGEMAIAAQQAGNTIDRELSDSAHHSAQEVGKLRGVFGKVMNAGMMIGGAIVGIGFASQQVVGSMSTLGIIDEKTAESFNKISEVVSLVGGIGAMLAPIGSIVVGLFGAIVPIVTGIVPAVATIGAAIFTFLISPIGLTIAAVVAGALVINEVLKRTIGVDAIGSIMSGVGTALAKPFAWAVQQIQAMWSNLMGGWFGKLFAPLIKIVTDVGQQLVSKLSENSPGPTQQIRENWRDMVKSVVKSVVGMVKKIAKVAWELTKVFVEIYHQIEKSVFGALVQIFISVIGLIGGLAIQVAWKFAPLLTVIGLLAFGIFLLKKNFLGLESILTHFFETIKGGGQVVIGVVRGTLTVAEGLITVLKGIPQAMQGNFAPMSQGFEKITQGFRVGTEQVGDGVKTLLVSQVHFLKGIVSGARQTYDLIVLVVQAISRAIAVIQKVAQAIGYVFTQVGKGVEIVKAATISTLDTMFFKFQEVRSVAIVLSEGVGSIGSALRAAGQGFDYFLSKGETMGQAIGSLIVSLVRQISEQLRQIPAYLRQMFTQMGESSEAEESGRSIGAQLLIGVASAFGYLAGVVKGVAVEIATELKQTAMAPAVLAVEQGIQSMINAWGTLRSGVTSIMTSMETLVGGSTAAIRSMMMRMLTLDAIQQSFALFATSGEEAGRRVAQSLIRSIRLVGTGISKLPDLIKTAFLQIPGYLRSAFSQVKDEAPQVGSSIGLKIFLGLTAALGGIVSFFGGLFSEILGSLRSDLLAPMSQGIGNALGGISGMVAEQLAPIGTLVKAGLDEADRRLMVFRTAMRALFDDAVEWVTTPWRVMPVAVEAGLDEADRRLMVFRTAARALFDDAVQEIATAWAGLTQPIDAVLTNIKTRVDQKAADLKEVMTAFVDPYVQAWKTAQTFTENTLSNISGAVNGAVQGIATAWAGLTQPIETALTNIKTRVDQKAADLKEVMTAFVDPYVQAWKTAQTFTENTLSNISNAVISFPDGIKTAFSDLIAALTGMWVGFAERIETTFSGLKQKIGDTAARLNPFTKANPPSGDGMEDAVAPSKNILNFWKKTNDSVTAEIQDLEGTAKEEGKNISKDLSEGSPGPSFWVRQNWAHTGEFVGNVIQQMQTDSHIAGEQIQKNLEVAAPNLSLQDMQAHSPGGQAAVGMALNTYETEELPSRKDMLHVFKTVIGEFFQSLPKGDLGAVIRQGNEREQMVRAMLEEKTGVAVPSRMEIAGAGIKSGISALKESAPALPEKIKQTAVSAYQSAQQGGMVNEGAVGGAGFGMGMLVESQFGVGAGLAADVTASLVVRKALTDYQALATAMKTLDEDVVYQQAGVLQRLQMLRTAAIAELQQAHVKAETQDNLIADVGGWAVGNTVDQALKATGHGIPLSGMAAAMHAIPKVVEGVNRVQGGEETGAVVKDVATRIIPAQAVQAATQSVVQGNDREQAARDSISLAIKNYKGMANEVQQIGSTIANGSDQTAGAWLDASQDIVGYWQNLGSQSDGTRDEIVNNLNHGASGATSSAWQNATNEITGNFDVLAAHAAVTSQKIAESMKGATIEISHLSAEQQALVQKWQDPNTSLQQLVLDRAKGLKAGDLDPFSFRPPLPAVDDAPYLGRTSQAGELTDAEHASIKNYANSDNSYQDVNNSLRGYGEPSDPGKTQQQIEDMKSGLAKLPRYEPSADEPMSRFMMMFAHEGDDSPNAQRINQHRAYMDSLQAGDTYTEQGFSSFSLPPAGAGGFSDFNQGGQVHASTGREEIPPYKFLVRPTEQSAARNITPYNNQGELEALYPPGMQFRVKSKKLEDFHGEGTKYRPEKTLYRQMVVELEELPKHAEIAGNQVAANLGQSAAKSASEWQDATHQIQSAIASVKPTTAAVTSMIAPSVVESPAILPPLMSAGIPAAATERIAAPPIAERGATWFADQALSRAEENPAYKAYKAQKDSAPSPVLNEGVIAPPIAATEQFVAPPIERGANWFADQALLRAEENPAYKAYKAQKDSAPSPVLNEGVIASSGEIYRQIVIELEELPKHAAISAKKSSDILGAAGQQSAALWESATNQIQGAIAEITPAVQVLTHGTQTSTSILFEALKQQAQSASTTVSALFKAGGDRVRTAWQSSTQAIGGVWSRLVESAKKAGQGIVDRLNHGCADETSSSWDRATANIVGNMNHLVQVAQTTGDRIAQSMQPQNTAVAPYRPNSSALAVSDRPGNLEMPGRNDSLKVQFAIAGLDSLKIADFAIREINAGVNHLSNELRTTLKQTTDVTAQQWSVVGDSVKGSLDEVAGVAKTTHQQIGQDVQPLLQVIGKHWNLLVQELRAQMITLGTNAVEFGNELVRNLWTRIQNLPQQFQNLMTQIQSSLAQIGQFLRSGFTNVTTSIQSAWSRLMQPINAVIQGIVTVSKAVNPIIQRFLGSGLGQLLVRGWQFFRDRVGQTVDFLLQKAQAAGGRFTNFLGNRLLSPISAAWTRLSEAVSSSLIRMAQQAQQTGQQIITKLGGALSNVLPPAVKVAFQEISAEARVTGQKILTSLQPLVQSIAQNWQKNGGVIRSALMVMAVPAQAAGQRIMQALGPEISARLPKAWAAMMQPIKQDLQRLTSSATTTGSEVANDLGAAVKGRITQAWTGITASVTQSMQRVSQRGEVAREQIKAQWGRVSQGAEEGIGAASQSLNALGSIVGELNPQLSSSLFFVGNLFDSGLQLAQSIPQLIAYFGTMFAGSTAATTANAGLAASAAAAGTTSLVANGQIAGGALLAASSATASGVVIGGVNGALGGSFTALGSTALVANTAISTGSFVAAGATTASGVVIGGVNGALSGSFTALGATALLTDAEIAIGGAAAAGSTAVSGGIMATINSVLSGSFAALGTAAGVAWSLITLPAALFIAAGLAVIGVVALIYYAVKNNWMGIGEVFAGLWSATKDLGAALWSAFAPLMPVLIFIGKIIGGVLLGAIWIVLQSLKYTVTSIGLIVKAVLFLAGLVGSVLIFPFQAIWFIIQGIGSLFNGLVGILGKIGSAIGTVFMNPIESVRSMVQGLVGFFSGIPGAIGSAFGAVWGMIPGPMRWMMEQAANGVAWVANAVTGTAKAALPTQAAATTAAPAQNSLSAAYYARGEQAPVTPGQQYAGGGLVTGPGTGTSDSIHALLSNREYVMPADVTGRNLPLLEAMRTGRADSATITVPQVMPMPRLPIPVRPESTPVLVGAPSIQFNLTIGDVSVNGANGTQQSADELVELIEMKLKSKLPEWLRDFVELRR